MKFELEEFHRNILEQELIADLLKIAKELNKVMVTRDEYDERGAYCSRTIERKFGSWNKALERAGLQKKRNMALLDSVWVFETRLSTITAL